MKDTGDILTAEMIVPGRQYRSHEARSFLRLTDNTLAQRRNDGTLEYFTVGPSFRYWGWALLKAAKVNQPVVDWALRIASGVGQPVPRVETPEARKARSNEAVRKMMATA